MSPTLNGSSAIRHFKHSDVIEIRDGIIFDFYTGLPHIHIQNHSYYYCHTPSTSCTIQVRALEKFRVVCVACGSRDAQTLAATENGALWAWGDGSFGKLGKGDTAGSHTPIKVKVFNTEEIAQLECGAQFSMMLTKDGKVYTW